MKKQILKHRPTSNRKDFGGVVVCYFIAIFVLHGVNDVYYARCKPKSTVGAEYGR